jgi:hypothetical protein
MSESISDKIESSCCVAFGTVGNLGQNVNDAYTLEKKDEFNSIGIHVEAPTGGTVQFEGTVDGVNWAPINLRSIEQDIYTQTTDNGFDFTGSIATLRAFRVKTIVAGSAPGTVRGLMSRAVSTLEGQEFGWPPHRFGFHTVHKDATYATAQSGTALWTPAAGKRFVITDIIMNVSGTVDGTISIYEETDTPGNRLFKGLVEVTTNKQFSMNHSYRVPFEAGAADNVLYIDTSGNMDVDIMLHGYEV